MILPISNEYRISSDRYQWIIEKARPRRRNGVKVIEWRSQAYYPTFEGALQGLGERMVRESEAVGFTDALLAVENIVTTLSRALPIQFKVTAAANDAAYSEVQDG